MKKVIIIAGVIALFVVVAVVAIGARFSPSPTARRAWKDNVIAEVSSRAKNTAWVTNELAGLRKTGTGDKTDSAGWFSERLVLMRNGEWLAYANICQKENRRISDLFLARGSDGRWYYSTYHFCRGMIVLRMEEQAEDLAAFAKTYYLRPFDGNSDECLQKTWPPDSK
jgi:hypothetical protein